MVWKISILVIVTVVWLYELFLHWLSMRSKNNPIPSCVADVYDEETYRKQLLYKADKNRLAMLQSAATFAVGFVLLLLNVYAAFAALFSDNTWTQLFAVVLLSAITSVVSIPFQYNDTMRIEERYGFNRTKKSTFWIDRIKERCLSCSFRFCIRCSASSSTNSSRSRTASSETSSPHCWKRTATASARST